MILTVVEFILGSFMHFLYDLCPCFLTAMIAPINESIFEHLKLALYPMLFVSFIVLWYRHQFNNKTLTALFFGIIVAIASIVLIYYFYRYGLGIESLVLDIILLLVSIGFGNYCAMIVYKHNLIFNQTVIMILYIGLIILFTLFTFFPPDLPIFIPQ
ncbi:MAG: DUF6512 family protein [Coprobacillus sp.]